MRLHIPLLLIAICSYSYIHSVSASIRHAIEQEETLLKMQEDRLPFFLNYFYSVAKEGVSTIRDLFIDASLSIGASAFIQDPYADRIAVVRHAQDGLCKEEIALLQNREPIIQEGLAQLLEVEVSGYKPRIGLCFSGGGFRAMLLTLGFLEGAQKTGLLNASSYMTGLSGSTWAIAAWIASKKPLKTFLKELASLISNGINHINDLEEIKLLSHLFLSKILSKQSLSIIDLYGAIVANTLLNDMGPERLAMTISQTHASSIDGKIPLPLYTTINTNTNPYGWLEVSPFEIGGNCIDAYIPVWAYGRKFSQGVSLNSCPEQSLGYFLGIFGSAFEASIEDIIRLSTNNIQAIKDQVPGFIDGLIDKMIDMTLNSPLNNFRLFPSMLRNFTQNMPEKPLSLHKTLCLVDAGIDFNLALPPLLRKERQVDIIIIYDASSDVTDVPELRRAVAYAKNKNLKFPPVDFKVAAQNIVSVFQDKKDPETPVIIYFPRIKNEAYDPSFDPNECVNNDYCSTLNCTYSGKQIRELSGLSRFTVVQQIDVIKNVINNVIALKS